MTAARHSSLQDGSQQALHKRRLASARGSIEVDRPRDGLGLQSRAGHAHSVLETLELSRVEVLPPALFSIKLKPVGTGNDPVGAQRSTALITASTHSSVSPASRHRGSDGIHGGCRGAPWSHPEPAVLNHPVSPVRYVPEGSDVLPQTSRTIWLAGSMAPTPPQGRRTPPFGTGWRAIRPGDRGLTRPDEAARRIRLREI
jgi:hypothetical protein